jgi:8-oxo-dGTP pyrophosphatase MutT (NUDIX family)
MIEYVCGFLISKEFDAVLMVKKEKPDWQKGLWNGIGGKIEGSEPPYIAMIREFKEEIGIDSVAYECWENIGKVTEFNGEWRVHFFKQFVRYLPKFHLTNSINQWNNDAGEQLDFLPYSGLLKGDYKGMTILNLNWIIPFIYYNDNAVFDVMEASVT